MNVRSTLLALAAVTAATLMTGIAVSPAMAEVHGITVRYDDLNLASPAGRHRLDGRLIQAATALCGRYDARELRLSSLSHACRRQAVRNARGQLAAALHGGDYANADMSVSQAAF
jgi:UrcA family protein